jgi:hypothetical protein
LLHRFTSVISDTRIHRPMTDPDSATDHHREPTARFVGAMIVLTILIFFLAVGLLAFKWLHTNEPAAELLIFGSDTMAGAQASVRSVDETTPYTSTFGAGGRFTLPFYLDPGSYIVRVTAKEGDLIDEREVTIRERQRIIIDLTRWERKISATAPAQSAPQTATPAPVPLEPSTAPATESFP